MTSFAIDTFQQTVNVLIKASDNDEDLTSADVNNRIKDALQQYGVDFPDLVTEDVNGDGGIYYNLGSLTSWSEGFSSVARVEYPAAAVASDEAPTILEDEDFDTDYWDGATHYIRFINVTPASGEAFRIRYTAPYTFASTPETVDVPGEDFFAICRKAACLACKAIAAKYSRLGDSPLGADSGAHTSKAQEFQNRGDDYCAQYRADMGLPPADSTGGQQKAASAYTNMDTAPEWPAGRNYIFHRNR